MFWAGDDSLLHVSVLHGDNPGDALSLLDESCTAVESAVRHAHLLTAIEYDGDSVARFIIVHNSADIQATALIFSSSQNASSSYSLALGTLHGFRLLNIRFSILPSSEQFGDLPVAYKHRDEESVKVRPESISVNISYIEPQDLTFCF